MLYRVNILTSIAGKRVIEIEAASAREAGQKIKDQGLLHFKESILSFDSRNYTCDDCEDRNTCEFAYDSYNTNGDCLALK